MKKRRGHKVIWTATVRDTDFLERKGSLQSGIEKQLDIEMTHPSSTFSGRRETTDRNQGSILSREEVRHIPEPIPAGSPAEAV